jgi:hypothetical protein
VVSAVWIDVDCSIIPPVLELREPDDFKDFKIVVRGVDGLVPRHVLEGLADGRASDPAWRDEFEKMLAYAKAKGWLTADGAIQGHVEFGS